MGLVMSQGLWVEIVLAYHSWLLRRTWRSPEIGIMLSIQEIVLGLGVVSFKSIDFGNFGLLGY